MVAFHYLDAAIIRTTPKRDSIVTYPQNNFRKVGIYEQQKKSAYKT